MPDTLYADKLVVVTRDTLMFRCYYFPFGAKKIRFADIERVSLQAPTVLGGKWRVHGTGDFKTWFPRDFKRHTRDVIFIAEVRNQRRRIGFTVENAEAMKAILRDKGLLLTTSVNR